ncbi:MAG: hypothetical protein ACR2RV_23530 [Verrucomicrobiales bacterium]
MANAAHSGDRLAYLADGRLYLKDGSAEPNEIRCTYAENLKQRTAELHQQNDWRHTDAGPVSEALALGAGVPDDGPLGTAIVAIAPSEKNTELLYGLNTDDVAGIFLRPLHQNGDEKRLIHTNESNIHNLSAPDEEGRVICSISRLDGLQNLSIYRIGSPGLTEITEGDSLDAAASWVPGKDGQLVYQSAGIGRNSNGQWIATGPASVEHLDTTRGKITTLLGDHQHDYLSPQISSDDKLYCIRRPYKGTGLLGLGGLAGGWLGAPSRIFSTILSWFSVRSTPEGDDRDVAPNDPTTDMGQILMPGNLIDVRQLREDAALRGEIDPDIVPRSWQLIETSASEPSASEARILARGLIAFHVSAKGEIYYSNGSAIFKMPIGGGKAEEVQEVGNVQQILSL